MARDKVKSQPIDGFVYEVTQLPAKQGTRIGAEILAMVAPFIGALVGEGNKAGKVDSIGDLDLRTFGIKAATDVFAEKLLSSEIESIRDMMAQHTKIYGPGFGNAGEDAAPGDGDGGPLSKNYDDHFAGRYHSMVKWFIFSLEVNFTGFFAELWSWTKTRYPALQSLTEVLSNLPNTSTGLSGDLSSPESQH